jgi:hypothetical protein
MGLKTGHQSDYLIEKLSFKSLINLIHQRKLRRLLDPGAPVVDIDASWVIRKYPNLSYDMKVTQLMRLCMLFVHNKCRVNIVFDGTTRHHTKRATTKRYVDAYRTKVEYQVGKGLLSRLNDQLKSTTDDEEIKQINADIATNKKN